MAKKKKIKMTQGHRVYVLPIVQSSWKTCERSSNKRDIYLCTWLLVVLYYIIMLLVTFTTRLAFYITHRYNSRYTLQTQAIRILCYSNNILFYIENKKKLKKKKQQKFSFKTHFIIYKYILTSKSVLDYILIQLFIVLFYFFLKSKRESRC